MPFVPRSPRRARLLQAPPLALLVLFERFLARAAVLWVLVDAWPGQEEGGGVGGGAGERPPAAPGAAAARPAPLQRPAPPSSSALHPGACVQPLSRPARSSRTHTSATLRTTWRRVRPPPLLPCPSSAAACGGWGYSNKERRRPWCVGGQRRQATHAVPLPLHRAHRCDARGPSSAHSQGRLSHLRALGVRQAPPHTLLATPNARSRRRARCCAHARSACACIPQCTRPHTPNAHVRVCVCMWGRSRGAASNKCNAVRTFTLGGGATPARRAPPPKHRQVPPLCLQTCFHPSPC